MWRQCRSIVLEVLLSLFQNKCHSTVCSPTSITNTEHMSGKAALTLREQWTMLDTHSHRPLSDLKAGTPRLPAPGPVPGGTRKLISPSVYRGYGGPGC